MKLLNARKAVICGSSYLTFDENKQRAMDDEVANILNLDIKDYKALMIKDFKGYNSQLLEGIAFKNIEDATYAADYINSKFVISALNQK